MRSICEIGHDAFCAASSACVSDLSFESGRAFPTQCWVAMKRIVETVDVFELSGKEIDPMKQS